MLCYCFLLFFLILFLGTAGDMSCAGEITESVQALPCVCAAMRCHLMRAEIWPPHPFRGPLLFVTPSGLQSCQLSLKHGSSSIKFEKTSILKVMPGSLHLSRDKGSSTRAVRVHQNVVKERLNAALYINAYHTHLPARQQLLKLSLLLSFLAQPMSAAG